VKKYLASFIGIFVAFLISAATLKAQCLVPEDQIVSGGPGKDGIPSLTNPEVVSAAEGDTFMLAEDLVLGVVVNGEARAYPHAILWWHEIINDVLGGKPVTVSFCPLTGSGLVYDPVIDEGDEGQVFNFGVSGLLFDNNLILFDRTTDTLWSQMRSQAICGSLQGKSPTLLPLVQMNWSAWKELYPEATVVSPNTGFSRNYDRYPYGDYDNVNNRELLFPQSVIDSRLPMKDTVLGIRNDGVARAYSMSLLEGGEVRSVIHDEVNGLPVAVVYDRTSAMLLGFSRILDDPTMVEEMTLTFDLVDDGTFPFKLRDRETGSLWSLTGAALEGALAGAQLQPLTDSYTAFWFAWAAFNLDSEIYQP
jgi:hypothetical protein